MGQAKFRKANDPSYGKPTSRIRGLIISPPIELSKDELFVKNSGLDVQDLRISLLYWDRLLNPQNQPIGFGPSPDEEFLISSGILSRPTYKTSSESTGEIVLEAQTNALLDMQNKEPGVWSLNHSENSIIVKGNLPTSDKGVTIQLLNALPIPSAEVPLAEILEFKQKRRSELLAFRLHFEGMASVIEQSPDSEEALRLAIKEIDKSCSDLVRTTREWQFPVKLSNVSASFNLDLGKAFTSAVDAWKSADLLSLGLTEKAIISGSVAVSSQFKISRDISLQPFRKTASPYRYIYSAQKYL